MIRIIIAIVVGLAILLFAIGLKKAVADELRRQGYDLENPNYFVWQLVGGPPVAGPIISFLIACAIAFGGKGAHSP